jgi:hypothetical protein
MRGLEAVFQRIPHCGVNRHRVMWVGRDRGDMVPTRGIGT